MAGGATYGRRRTSVSSRYSASIPVPRKVPIAWGAAVPARARAARHPARVPAEAVRGGEAIRRIRAGRLQRAERFGDDPVGERRQRPADLIRARGRAVERRGGADILDLPGER